MPPRPKSLKTAGADTIRSRLPRAASLLSSCVARTVTRLNVQFASEDFCADTGIVRTDSRIEMLHARSAIVLAAKAYKLQAIDMVRSRARCVRLTRMARSASRSRTSMCYRTSAPRVAGSASTARCALSPEIWVDVRSKRSIPARSRSSSPHSCRPRPRSRELLL